MSNVIPVSDTVSAFVDAVSIVSQESGLSCQVPGSIKGVSGVTHKVDLICSNDRGKVLVDIRRESSPVEVIPVLSLYMKLFDSRSSGAALIAVPNASSLAKKLSQIYRLMLIETESPLQAAFSLKKKVLEILSLHSQKTAVPNGKVDAARALRYTKSVRYRSVVSALDLLILQLLNGTTLTGYDVISRVHLKFGMLLSPGTVYPILKRLKKEGLVTTTETGRKNIYSHTPTGLLVSDTIMQEFQNIQMELLSYLRGAGKIVA